MSGSTEEEPRFYGVDPIRRAPLVRFMLDALEACGCRILYEPPPDRAPFRITFETPEGERMGIMVYAFLANRRVTKNRPADERRFQVKYGSKDGGLHTLWQDRYGLYTTLMVGIDPADGYFVGVDPVFHSPTRFFISIEHKDAHVAEIQRKGWHAWDRRAARTDDDRISVLVGGTPGSFLRYVRFERDALGEDQGHRQLLAERAFTPGVLPQGPLPLAVAADVPARVHALAREFELSEAEVLDLIANARRLKMAVRGWVAETHLVSQLQRVPGVSDCVRVDAEGAADVELRYLGSRPLRIECKNVLRQRAADGHARLDFQRTRASIADPCSRYYAPEDFDVVAACLHAVTERWEFRFARTATMAPHDRCAGKLQHRVRIDGRWATPVEEVLREAASA